MELSVIIISVGDVHSLRRCLEALVPQTTGHQVEVIIPYDQTNSALAELSPGFPQMQFLDLGKLETAQPAGTMGARLELFDRRASAALRSARGGIVALVQDWGAPCPDWVDQVLDVHRKQSHAVIGGVVEHEGGEALNWAIFLQDFGRHQLPAIEGPRDALTDVNVSYKREALESLRELWNDRYNEVTVNNELVRRGAVLWQNPRMIVRHDRGRASLARVLAERFGWGRIRGGARAYKASFAKRVIYLAATPLIPAIMILKTAQVVLRGQRHQKEFLRALPAMILLVTAWAAGEFWGTLTGRPRPV